LFGNLKTRSFDLEATHITDIENISRLVVILALAYFYALQVDIWRVSQGHSIRFKNSIERPLKSFFQHGLDYLQ